MSRIPEARAQLLALADRLDYVKMPHKRVAETIRTIVADLMFRPKRARKAAKKAKPARAAKPGKARYLSKTLRAEIKAYHKKNPDIPAAQVANIFGTRPDRTAALLGGK